MLNALTPAEQKEVRVYGVTVAQMRDAVNESLAVRFYSPELFVMSLMSDAQHEIEHDMAEDARQTLNRAKWILVNYVMGKEVAA